MSFLDRVKIYVKAGKGGDGCLSFRREKFIEFGGPNGGNGGKGGDVYIKTERNLTTLLELAYNPHIEAKNGEKGGTYNKTGVGADDLTIYVPCGTIVKKDGEIIADLTEEGQSVLVAKGGRGGRGNQSFKTHSNTAPRISEIGQPGEEITLYLELKVLADLGLVGFPNAGKSTFLSRVSAARPKIADYPFTTLNPNLGIAMHKKVSFVIADIPGIIEGASEGKGLGHQFLKHIERTRVLLHLVDPMGFKDIDAVESVKVIEKELKTFDRELAKKPRIIALNKADLPEAKEVYNKIVKKYKKHKVFLISAATGEGVDKVLNEIVKVISATPVPNVAISKSTVAVHGVEPLFKIVPLEDGRVQVFGRKIEDMVNMTHFNQLQGVERLRNIFKKIGLEKALIKKGVMPGDIIVVGQKEFEWSGTELDSERAEQPDFEGYKRRTTQAERLEKRRQRRLKKEEK
ncbi:GTP-binding protein Obg/CgtA [Elusimicrobium minutum Pei191]|uniref:GTPase Obg n=1 Tax=Elusimicrobium minutum (strain Pei191) TaxID=445932 RepID=OBG_ELUMP|nr:GTPase ObgE [Elusimicrobium minutum]B2KAW2.1 RecName: Full=GTPase Obg; AltName: Full=GTP-binding protein Obg [Elusimicrobium minutum Pei191]ACC97658.1 GTP-binding protein Obg/CgtA [Elusimicrobium minutum Pei191]